MVADFFNEEEEEIDEIGVFVFLPLKRLSWKNEEEEEKV